MYYALPTHSRVYLRQIVGQAYTDKQAQQTGKGAGRGTLMYRNNACEGVGKYLERKYVEFIAKAED